MQAVNELESFYLKYGKDTKKLERVKDTINELESSIPSNISRVMQKLIDQLDSILDELREILFSHYANSRNYPILKKYLINREYYSQDERNKAFQEQLKYNDYDIYLINSLSLVNLFDKNNIISFNTENELDEYIENREKYGIEIIIKPKTNDFELEFKQYYNYLLKHGYNYSITDKYGPLTIAQELATFFGGQVLTKGFFLYSKSFSYPKDFNNKEYLEKLNEFILLHSDKSFVSDYREMCLLEKKVELLIDTLSNMKNKINNTIESMKENVSSLSHEILFLDKCYKVYGPKFGYWEYIYSDYYKALDTDFLRKSLNDVTLGAWKTKKRVSHSKDENYTTCVYGNYFSWGSLKDVITGDEKIRKELETLNYSSQEEIESLIQDKYIIESSENLNYETLLSEYYSNFAMDPKEFLEMMHLKYGCKVVCPNIISQSTKLIVRKAS